VRNTLARASPGMPCRRTRDRRTVTPVAHSQSALHAQVGFTGWRVSSGTAQCRPRGRVSILKTQRPVLRRPRTTSRNATKKPMESEASGIDSILAQLAADDAQAGSALSVAIWQRISGALSPVIGAGGVIALYRRSLHLSRAAYPWLTTAPDDRSMAGELAALLALLQQQSREDAIAAGRSMLRTFNDLLISLIGRSLTEHLLASVWDNAARGSAAQDISP
jgi:hypothetical protein